MLRLKHLPIQSFNECIVYVHRDCNVYKVDDIQTMTRVEIHGGPVPICAFLNVVDDNRLVKSGELGVNDEAFRRINLPENANVTMVLTDSPQSLSLVRKKMHSNTLTTNEYKTIVGDIATHKYANIDISAFLTACGSFMTAQEIVSMAQALNFGQIIHWDEEDIVVDCHSLGNVPGNNTDIIISAIVAAYGLPIPKTVVPHRDSCFGVANTMRVFADIDKDSLALRSLIKANRGAIINFEQLPVSETSTQIQTISRYLNIEEEAFAIIQLLAMKIAVGVTHLVIDVPVGPKTLVKTAQDAVRVRKLLEYAGDMLGIKIDAVVTDGREPVGAGIGAILEARDIMQILRNKEDAPKELQEKALFLAGRILEFDPKLRGGQGYSVAKEILSSGRALEAFNRMVSAQGIASQADLGNLTRDILAPNSGTVLEIDNQQINKIGVFAGAIQYAGAGLYLVKKVGDKINTGDVLYRIHSCNSTDFALVNSLIEGDNGYEIGH